MANYKVPIITGTTLTSGDLLRWDGTAWVNVPDSTYLLVEDNATEAPAGKADGYVGVAKIGSDGRLYFTVEGSMYYVDGTIVPVTTGNPIGLLLALTYNLA